jgi:hypothetical protein
MQLQEKLDYIAETEDKREKIQALSLAKECYSMKLELLTNATIVDDAIRFVTEYSTVVTTTTTKSKTDPAVAIEERNQQEENLNTIIQ